MLQIKYYDILKGNSEINWQEMSIKDLLNNSDTAIFNENIDKYKNLSDLSWIYWKKILNILFNNLWITIDVNSLKNIWSISSEVRKIIKYEKKELLEIIDSPKFLIPYTYLLCWFNIWLSEYNWKEWINSHYSLASMIMKILEQENINISWFLCAHREHESINKYSLVEKINSHELSRVINLIKGIIENFWKTYNIDFYNTDWDNKWMNAVFPSLFLKYLERWEINLLSEQLSSHLNQVREIEQKNVKIHSVSEHFNDTQSFLIGAYWTDWSKMTKDQLELLSENDKIAEIAYYMTYNELIRFENSFDEFRSKYSENDIQKLINLNIENAKIDNNQELVRESIEIFFNKSSLEWKSLYETVFYYLWWQKVKNNNWIWVWFDRDHDLFQSESFSLWYNPSGIKSMVPLLYWRRTWNKSGTNLNDISFRQFWHHY